MGKLNITGLNDDELINPNLVSNLISTFYSQTNKYPDALLVTDAQARKYLLANGKIMPDFKGVPIEVEKKADETATINKTISGILAGMHASRVKEVADVYQMLENMKTKMENIHVEVNSL